MFGIWFFTGKANSITTGDTMRLLIILLSIFLLGCGEKPKTVKNVAKIRAGYDSRQVPFDQIAGWPSDHDNDGSLWSGLAARAGMAVDVSAAIQSNGRVTRRPFKDSLVPSESASSVSNDMILGVISGLLYQKKVKTLESVFNYGKVNSWVMGYPAYMVGRVVLKPNNIALLARSIGHLGGPKYQEGLIPLIYVPLQDSDYPTHLQLVSFVVARDVGEANFFNELIVQETCSYNQNDALAMAVCGNYERAADLLLSDYQYPSYVRGSEAYKTVHWMLAAKLILEAH
jgi:hypothetical protein